jgi:tetratricopeptide (TPR) repeat protein
MVDATMAGALDELVDSGTLDEALEGATRLAARLESQDVGVLTEVRALELRILTLRGQAARMADSLDWLEAASRETGAAEDALIGLGSSAFARAGLGQADRASALLTEIEATPRVREALSFAAYLPAMVRTALAIGDRQLAERLVGGVEPLHPYAQHALVAANAALAEDRGDLETAANAYAEAADRWNGFGVVPESGFALLGRGRCLLGLDRPTEAGNVLRAARDIFERLDAAPMRSETDALLAEAITLSS